MYLSDRYLVSNVMCFVGIMGVILMIINNEIIFATGHDRDTIVNWFIKLILSITTLILINLVIYYHYLNLKFFAAQNSLDDWRAGLTIERIFRILLEILICAIHPIPGSITFEWTTHMSNKADYHSQIKTARVYIDILLSLPMFFRLYLICRVMLLHSKLFTGLFLRF